MTVIRQGIWILLAVLFAGYGILVRSVGSGTRFFLVWMVLAVLALGCAAAAHFHLWKWLPLWLKIVFLLILLAAGGLFVFVESRIVGSFHEQAPGELDCLLVPGAQIYEEGPSVVLRYRLNEACEYLEEHEDTVCIVSGGQGYNEPYPEAVGMKGYLAMHGIDENRILMETEAKNTKENMELSQKLFDPEHDRVGIVTNNFHVYRACALARKSGIRKVYGIPAGSTPLYLPNNLLREFLGVIKDFACGNI